MQADTPIRLCTAAADALGTGRLGAWADETASTLDVRCVHCRQPVPTERVAGWLYGSYGTLPTEPSCSDEHWRMLIATRREETTDAR